MNSLRMIAQQNGAQAVLATLWSVNDIRTRRLMSDFYARWVGAPAAGKAEALRQVQLAFLYALPASRSTKQSTEQSSAHAQKPAAAATDQDEGAIAVALEHPFYWAPFILTGNFH